MDPNIHNMLVYIEKKSKYAKYIFFLKRVAEQPALSSMVISLPAVL